MPRVPSPGGRSTGRLLRPLRRALIVAGACLSLATLPACDRNPATGKRQLSLVSEEQELQIGREAATEIAQSPALPAGTYLKRVVPGTPAAP